MDVVDGIGSSEAYHIYISQRPGEMRPGTIGRLVPGYEGRLVDEAGEDGADSATAGPWRGGGAPAAGRGGRRRGGWWRGGAGPGRGRGPTLRRTLPAGATPPSGTMPPATNMNTNTSAP